MPFITRDELILVLKHIKANPDFYSQVFDSSFLRETKAEIINYQKKEYSIGAHNYNFLWNMLDEDAATIENLEENRDTLHYFKELLLYIKETQPGVYNELMGIIKATLVGHMNPKNGEPTTMRLRNPSFGDTEFKASDKRLGRFLNKELPLEKENYLKELYRRYSEDRYTPQERSTDQNSKDKLILYKEAPNWIIAKVLYEFLDILDSIANDYTKFSTKKIPVPAWNMTVNTKNASYADVELQKWLSYRRRAIEVTKRDKNGNVIATYLALYTILKEFTNDLMDYSRTREYSREKVVYPMIADSINMLKLAMQEKLQDSNFLKNEQHSLAFEGVAARAKYLAQDLLTNLDKVREYFATEPHITKISADKYQLELQPSFSGTVDLQYRIFDGVNSKVVIANSIALNSKKARSNFKAELDPQGKMHYVVTAAELLADHLEISHVKMLMLPRELNPMGSIIKDAMAYKPERNYEKSGSKFNLRLTEGGNSAIIEGIKLEPFSSIPKIAPVSPNWIGRYEFNAHKVLGLDPSYAIKVRLGAEEEWDIADMENNIYSLEFIPKSLPVYNFDKDKYDSQLKIKAASACVFCVIQPKLGTSQLPVTVALPFKLNEANELLFDFHFVIPKEYLAQQLLKQDWRVSDVEVLNKPQEAVDKIIDLELTKKLFATAAKINSYVEEAIAKIGLDLLDTEALQAKLEQNVATLATLNSKFREHKDQPDMLYDLALAVEINSKIKEILSQRLNDNPNSSPKNR